MDPGNIGQSSGGPSGIPAKRKRGRPPKDPNQKQAEAGQVSHDLVGEQPYIPPDILGGREDEVGQTVTGVVEAEFEAGYLLSVRIGNSNINMKGVVFKPEHEVQITPENDVAPYLPMIGRKDVPFPAGNLAQSPSQNAGVQTVATVPGKRKYRSRKAPASVPPASIPQAGPKGIFTPVILEPQSVLPPNQSVPAGQIFMSTQDYSNNQVITPMKVQEEGSLNEGTSEEKSKQMAPTDVDTCGSSNTKTDDGKAIEKSSPEDSGALSKQEQGQTNEHVFAESSVAMSYAPVMIPLFNYGTGNMTELLQAQEDMKDNQGQVAEEPRLPRFENSKPTVENDPKNQEPHDSKAGHM